MIKDKAEPYYEHTYLATWNVRGTYYTGALQDLEKEAERYKIEILAIQETKQKDTSITELEKYIFFNSGDNKNRFLGTGFLVSKRLKHAIVKFTAINERLCHLKLVGVVKFTAINERLCHLKLVGVYRKINIINVHAPSEDKDDEEKVAFYETIEELYDTFSDEDMNIIVGDEEKVAFYETIEELYDTFSDEDMNIIVGDFNAKIGMAYSYEREQERLKKMMEEVLDEPDNREYDDESEED
ncbi:hypothetical protein QE152_g12528 [Popillia japonica]|uniref:Endonuclease/exonuclease/phosphatase domain-containing protein n=1 Tax=Popillia japonica TaxID=7064 RepID=A0AAW1LPR9_POPJA